MVTTKYCPVNVTSLLAGILISLLVGWLAVMTMAFGADPVHDFRSAVVMVALWASLALLPACLITFKWPTVGAIISWSVVGLSCLSVWASPVVILFLIGAGIEGLIANGIASRSEGASQTSVVPK
jgi:hypothetical protein